MRKRVDIEKQALDLKSDQKLILELLLDIRNTLISIKMSPNKEK